MADAPEARSGPPSQSGSNWWTSIKSTFSSEPRSRTYDDDEEDEPLLPSRLGKRSRIRTGWEQIVAYIVILALGVVAGGFIGRRYSSRGGERDHGPMVAPVWTLPPPSGLPRNPAYLVEGYAGAVAAEDETCSNLGLSILKDKNGTAVDAAVTTTLCIGLFNAFSSGIGGGGFMVIRVPEGPYREGLEEEFKENGLVAIDFRETSPENSEKEMYGVKRAGRMAAQVGGLAVGVPGELRGLELAHSLYGSLPWEDVVMPVAELARGWQVSRSLAGRLRVFGQFMLDEPIWKEVYAPRGYLAVEGEWIKRTAYGKTLEKVAKHGADAFYNGEVAKHMINKLDSLGGVMTLKDLKKFKAIAYPPIHQVWNGKTVFTTAAPSSGAMLLAILNILEEYDFPSTPESEGGCNGPLNTHRLLEAMKFAFGARSEVTDPAYATTEQKERYMEFTTKKWAKEARAKITDGTHDADYYGLHTDTPVDHGTTHLSVLDRWGGAASITSTVNLIWGSHVMDNETGVIFNDEQDDFSVPGAADAFGLWPSPWNYPAPGKKPLSSTAASIIMNHDNSVHMVLGGSGGSRIFPSLAQVLLNLQCGLNLSEAVERPRVHDQIVPNVTTLEVGPEGVKGEWKELVDGLKARGHQVGLFDINIAISEVQAILVDNGTIWATSDSRKYGVAAAY